MVFHRAPRSLCARTPARCARASPTARRAASDSRTSRPIENLQRIYGYYFDRAQWDQMADLFAETGTIEFAQTGVYAGKRHVRQFLGTMGPQGGEPGWMNEHIQLQIVVTVAPDGRTGAFTQSRTLDDRPLRSSPASGPKGSTRTATSRKAASGSSRPCTSFPRSSRTTTRAGESTQDRPTAPSSAADGRSSADAAVRDLSEGACASVSLPQSGDGSAAHVSRKWRAFRGRRGGSAAGLGFACPRRCVAM